MTYLTFFRVDNFSLDHSVNKNVVVISGLGSEYSVWVVLYCRFNL